MNHLELAHSLWKRHLFPGDFAIDATCGRGRDTLVLAKLVGPKGRLMAVDIQEEALNSAQTLCPHSQIEWVHSSHHNLLPSPAPNLVVYNLGYLPGGDKQITTKLETTLLSIKKFLNSKTGAISVMLYPGHSEGAREKEALLALAETLPAHWKLDHHISLGRLRAPSLLWIENLQNR